VAKEREKGPDILKMRATKQAEAMPQGDFFLDISKFEELNMIGRRNFLN
jgi:hypothetical protein